MTENYGSFVKVKDDDGTFLYAGLSKDLSLLPTENIPTWRKAYCIDTAILYIFEATSGQWYQQ